MNFETSNPIAFKSRKINALDEAFADLSKTIREYAERENLTEEDVTLLAKLLLEAYSLKKAEYIVESKINRIGSYMNTAICRAFKMNEDQDSARHYTDLLYVRHTKHLLTNE